MSCRTNFPQIRIRMTARANGAGPMVAMAMRQNGRLLVSELQKMTGTQYASTADLRRMGHPYARKRFGARLRSGRGLPAPAYLINRQRGDLTGSFRAEISFGLDKMMVVVRNDTKHARYILAAKGTRKMIARPTIVVALQRTMPRRMDNLISAKRAIMHLG